MYQHNLKMAKGIVGFLFVLLVVVFYKSIKFHLLGGYLN